MTRITPQSIPGCNESKFDHLLCQPEQPSFIDFFYKQLLDDVENNRLEQIRERLRDMGYMFNDMYMLKEFLTDNATIVTRPDKPDYREMYLFAGTRDQVTVGAWWETYEFVQPAYEDLESGFKITVIAGKPPIH